MLNLSYVGLQEYVEAVTFQHFITNKMLLSLEDINRQLIFDNDVSIKFFFF